MCLRMYLGKYTYGQVSFNPLSGHSEFAEYILIRLDADDCVIGRSETGRSISICSTTCCYHAPLDIRYGLPLAI